MPIHCRTSSVTCNCSLVGKVIVHALLLKRYSLPPATYLTNAHGTRTKTPKLVRPWIFTANWRLTCRHTPPLIRPLSGATFLISFSDGTFFISYAALPCYVLGVKITSRDTFFRGYSCCSFYTRVVSFFLWLKV